MARDVISKVANDVVSIDSPSSIEEITRYIVAQVMEDEDRLLAEDEIFEIAEDVVRGEDIPVVEETLDNGVAYMTDVEWDNVPDERKVTDTDGDSSVIIEGKVCKVVLTESRKAATIASRIAKDINDSFNLYRQIVGQEMDFDSYHESIIEREYTCPNCGSPEAAVVWYDDEVVILSCAECGYQWSEYIVPEEEQVEAITAEDVEIVNEDDTVLIGYLYYDPNEQKFAYEVWYNGEAIYTDLADTADQVYAIFDAMRETYATISEDMKLKDVETGEEEIVEFVDDEVETTARVASRAQIALEIATGRKIADMSNVFADKVYDGDTFKDAHGNEIEVVSSDDNVTFIYSNWDESVEDYRSEYRALSKQAFFNFVADNGYELR